jgi:Ser/Thr protein kinase RdoA (MazF antagonist)
VARQGAAIVVKNLDTILSREMQITHGDPSTPNLFVDGSSPQLVGAIDWDYARFDLVISDAATMAQTNSLSIRDGIGLASRVAASLRPAVVRASPPPTATSPPSSATSC